MPSKETDGAQQINVYKKTVHLGIYHQQVL